MSEPGKAPVPVERVLRRDSLKTVDDICIEDETDFGDGDDEYMEAIDSVTVRLCVGAVSVHVSASSPTDVDKLLRHDAVAATINRMPTPRVAGIPRRGDLSALLRHLSSDDERLEVIRSLGVCLRCGRVMGDDSSCSCDNDE